MFARHGCPRFGSMLGDGEARTLSWGDPIVSGSAPGSLRVAGGDGDVPAHRRRGVDADVGGRAGRDGRRPSPGTTSCSTRRSRPTAACARSSRARATASSPRSPGPRRRAGGARRAARALRAEPWPTAVAAAGPDGRAHGRGPAPRRGQLRRPARSSAPPGSGPSPTAARSWSRRPTRDLVVDELGDEVDAGRPRRAPPQGPRPARARLAARPPRPRRRFPPLRSLDAVPQQPARRAVVVHRPLRRHRDRRRLAPRQPAGDAHRPGGAGKTRLAQQVAAEIVERFPDGAWWVDLVGVDDPALVPSAISRAACCPEDPRRPSRRARRRAGAKRVLLVLDNCEHLLDAVRRRGRGSPAACPDVVGAGDEPGAARRPGRVELARPAAGAPARGRRRPVAALSQFDAVRLFVDRATRPAELPAHRRQRGQPWPRSAPARRHPARHRARRGAVPRAHAGADPRRARRRVRAARGRTAVVLPATRRSTRRSVEPLAARRGRAGPAPPAGGVRGRVHPRRRRGGVRRRAAPPSRCSTRSSTSSTSRSSRWTTALRRRGSGCWRRCASSRAATRRPGRRTCWRRATRRTSPTGAHCGRCSRTHERAARSGRGRVRGP